MTNYKQASQVILAFLEDMNEAVSLHSKHVRWVREALEAVGFRPGVSERREYVKIENKFFPKPEGYRYARSIHLCRGSSKQQVYCTSQSNAFTLAQKDDCCSFYCSTPGIGGQLVIMETFSGFEIPYEEDFDKAEIIYLGPIHGEDGYPLVPYQAEQAVYAYMRWKLYTSRRSANPKGVPMSQLNSLYSEWSRACGDAKGELATPSVMDMHRFAAEHMGNRLKGPKSIR